MKTKTSLYLILLLAFGAFSAGCANTAKGVSKDYHKAEDNVEKAVK
jgi:predicted small secreted protein